MIITKKFIKKSVIVLLLLFILAGLVLLIYPQVSNLYGKHVVNEITEEFDNRVENKIKGSYKEAKKKGEVNEQGELTSGDNKGTYVVYKKDIARLKKDSLKYNKTLKKNQDDKLTDGFSFQEPCLSLSKYGIFDGIYGYIEAKTIGMKLPIYLGTGRNHMDYGAVHLTYTSLPTGGRGNNCAIAGHSGYIGRIFFDDIKNLNIGDTITVKNYWSTLKYSVVEKKTVKPLDSSDIRLEEDKDKLVLITCISDGSGGFNRYLICAER